MLSNIYNLHLISVTALKIVFFVACKICSWIIFKAEVSEIFCFWMLFDTSTSSIVRRTKFPSMSTCGKEAKINNSFK